MNKARNINDSSTKGKQDNSTLYAQTKEVFTIAMQSRNPYQFSPIPYHFQPPTSIGNSLDLLSR